MRDKFEIIIRPAGSDAGIVQVFEIPKSYWEAWFEVKMKVQMRASGKFNVADPSIRSDMIYVKRRWYHDVWNWLYFKFKGSEVLG